jgi:hypothetical protein
MNPIIHQFQWFQHISAMPYSTIQCWNQQRLNKDLTHLTHDLHIQVDPKVERFPERAASIGWTLQLIYIAINLLENWCSLSISWMPRIFQLFGLLGFDRWLILSSVIASSAGSAWDDSVRTSIDFGQMSCWLALAWNVLIQRYRIVPCTNNGSRASRVDIPRAVDLLQHMASESQK